MEEKITIAAITALFTIVTILIKDYLLKLLHEKRESKKNSLEIYLTYSEPLCLSLSSLFWRLKEIIELKGRDSFLIKNKSNIPYEEYKYISTLYRLASVLGWLTAIKKEQSHLKLNKTTQDEINLSIKDFEKALADGQHIEKIIINNLINLWNIDKNTLDEKTSAIQLVNIIENIFIKTIQIKKMN